MNEVYDIINNKKKKNPYYDDGFENNTSVKDSFLYLYNHQFVDKNAMSWLIKLIYQ